MLGKNPKRPIIENFNGNLEIKEIFPSFQGDGPFLGHPAIMVHFGGCNLACNFCEAEFENFTEMEIDEVIIKIQELSKNSEGKIIRKLVVLTGGEPLRQPIEILCDKLIESNFDVLIETNGTYYRDINYKVKIICSPRNEENGLPNLRDAFLRRIFAFKFLISKQNLKYNSVPDMGQSMYDTPVYLQPIDEQHIVKNLENMQYTIELAEKLGYNYTIQANKIIGIR